MAVETGMTAHGDNLVATFQLEGRAVRGRMIRLGDTMNEILGPHVYPLPLARIVGEAVMLAALVGNALKFDGRLILQANGDGPVRFVVAEYLTTGSVRGMAQYDVEAVTAALEQQPEGQSILTTLLGKGAFAMTIDQGSDMDQYQGVVALEGDSLSDCAEAYFSQSEQVETRIHLAVGEIWNEDTPKAWRGGGAMIQLIAADESRGSAEDDWDHARALFETISDAEILDPALETSELVYRLFHEDGARLFEPVPLTRHCSCSRERLAAVLKSFSQDDIDHMMEDGQITMTCEYCKSEYRFSEAQIPNV